MIIRSFTVPTMSSQHFSTPLISSAIGQVDTGKSGLCSKYLAVQSIIIAQVWPCKAFQWHQNLQLAICLCYRPSQHKRLKYTQTKLRHIPEMIQEKHDLSEKKLRPPRSDYSINRIFVVMVGHLQKIIHVHAETSSCWLLASCKLCTSRSSFLAWKDVERYQKKTNNSWGSRDHRCLGKTGASSNTWWQHSDHSLAGGFSHPETWGGPWGYILIEYIY